MILIQDKVNLTQNQISFLDEVLGLGFPWFFQEAYKNSKQFGHCVMMRDEQNRPIPGRINSPVIDVCSEILLTFCKEHDIQVNNILRVGINCTLYDVNNNFGIHVDHNFPHYNFILYINEFTNGDTVIYYDNEQEIYRIKPEKYKAVIFPGFKHAQESCSPGERRVVLVLTFN